MRKVSSLNENSAASRPSVCRCHIGYQSTRNDTYEDFQCVTIFVSGVCHLLGSWFSWFLDRNFHAIYDDTSAQIQAFEITGHVLINQFPAGSDVKFLPGTVHEINPCNKDVGDSELGYSEEECKFLVWLV